MIANNIHELKDDKDWASTIAFSNILKIAPWGNQEGIGHGGITNPDEYEANSQAGDKYSWKLYKMEIDELRPDYVIQITGIKTSFGEYPELDGWKNMNINNDIVKLVYEKDGRKIIVTRRPERIAREPFVKGVLKEIRRMK